MIPKILHRVWPGGGTIPDRFEGYWKQWKHLHPKWELHTWTGDGFKLMNRELYEMQDNFGAKSDILRLEVLYQMGGVYVDTDMEPLRSIQALTKIMRCFVGIHLGGGPSNAIMGCEPHHPAILTALEHLKLQTPHPYRVSEIINRTGPELLQRAWACNSDVSMIDQTVLGTDPNEVTDQTLVIHHRTTRWANKHIVAASQSQ